MFEFCPDLGLKRSRDKPEIPGTVPTDRHTTIPNDSGPISACFHKDPKLFNSEIAQPSNLRFARGSRFWPSWAGVPGGEFRIMFDTTLVLQQG